MVVGFGSYRAALERARAALARGDLERGPGDRRAGRALEARGASAAAAPLRYLLAFLHSLTASERERYLAAARVLSERVTFTGRLEHEELAELLPACEALVVPSTFPESFGMVAVEARRLRRVSGERRTFGPRGGERRAGAGDAGGGARAGSRSRSARALCGARRARWSAGSRPTRAALQTRAALVAHGPRALVLGGRRRGRDRGGAGRLESSSALSGALRRASRRRLRVEFRAP